MKILMILPEFEEGGVERHVLWLSTELSALGHSVWIATAGGRLEAMLPPEIRVFHLPVHRKNPATAIYCALRLAALCRTEGIDLLHAHSRVPAWIAWWTSRISGKPWVFTAHACYSKNAGVFPLKRSNGTICVSETVRSHLATFLPAESIVIRNGLPESGLSWKGNTEKVRQFLFVGRLTPLKGLDIVLQALCSVKELDWTLDILGDGPKRSELESFVMDNGLEGKVTFHGVQNDVGGWMARKDCLLFPSLSEGFGLVFMQALKIGIPCLASDLPATREILGRAGGLLEAGNVSVWEKAIGELLRGERRAPKFDPARVHSLRKMCEETLKFYDRTLLMRGEQDK